MSRKPRAVVVAAALALAEEARTREPGPPSEPHVVVASYAPEVLVDGAWSGNALRFATEDEAARWGAALLCRWFVPTDARAVPSTDPVNYRLTADGDLARVAVDA